MARRSDHQLMIEQKVDGKNTWAVILLLDKDEIVPNAFVTGLWKQTNDSYNDEEIKFTSAHPQYLYFEWEG